MNSGRSAGLDTALGGMPELEELDATHAERFPMFALGDAPAQPPRLPAGLATTAAFDEMPRHRLADLLDAEGTPRPASMERDGAQGGGGEERAGRGTDDSVSGGLVVDATTAPPAAAAAAAATGVPVPCVAHIRFIWQSMHTPAPAACPR